MKKIIYINKEVQIGDMVAYNGVTIEVTDKSVEANPSIFKVVDKSLELLDKAKRDYPVGTVFNSKYGAQKVLGDNPFIGILGTIQINTDKFPGGGTIYNPENGWAEILHLKFTTEDGVDIYGDMRTYFVHPSDTCDIDYYHFPWGGGSKGKGNKYFYHKENALAYIKKHREKTLEDYENLLVNYGGVTVYKNGATHDSAWYWFKTYEPKLYYTKILQLIADDLNDGWEPDFTNHDEKKWFITKENTTFKYFAIIQSVVYFKSGDLAIKARNILGDKVKYLFN